VDAPLPDELLSMPEEAPLDALLLPKHPLRVRWGFVIEPAGCLQTVLFLKLAQSLLSFRSHHAIRRDWIVTLFLALPEPVSRFHRIGRSYRARLIARWCHCCCGLTSPSGYRWRIRFYPDLVRHDAPLPFWLD
jgi:hypothetical protein